MCPATGTYVNRKKSAAAFCPSTSFTCLRSGRGRICPANGAGTPGNRVRSGGTRCGSPTSTGACPADPWSGTGCPAGRRHDRVAVRPDGHAPVLVAEVDVLVFFLDELVPGRRLGLYDVDAGGDAVEGVPAVEDPRADLVEVAQAVESVERLEAGAVVALGPAGQAVVPAVAPDHLQGVALVEDAVRRRGRRLPAPYRAGPVGPAEGEVVHVGVVERAVAVEVVDDPVAQGIPVQVHLHPRNAGLPRLADGQRRIVLGAGRRVVDDAGDAAVLTGRVGALPHSMTLVWPMKAWKASSSTGPTSVRERLLPVLGLMAG